MEQFEHRLCLSAVSWINPSGGTWDVPSNWSTGIVPGIHDDVTISTAPAATITIQSGDTELVHAVTTAFGDTLSITGGSLTVSGNSTLNGPLAMTGGSLTATGVGTDVTANGATSLNGTTSGGDIFAEAGATLSLPQLTSYTPFGNMFEADGAGSVLDVSALTNVAIKGDNLWYINATIGGEIKFDALTSMGDGTLRNSNVQLQDSGDSSIVDPKLTALNGVNAMLDGTDQQIAKSWTSFTWGYLNLSGSESLTLPNLSDADGSGLQVSGGGTLTLPALTSYSRGPGFSAAGAGSVLDVSALTNLSPQGTFQVYAAGGGEVKLSGLKTLAGSIIIGDTEGGSIIDPNLTTLNGVDITLDGTDAHVADSWTSFDNGVLNVTGGVYNLPGLTNIDGSYVHDSNGASFSLPKLTSFITGVSGGGFSVGDTGSLLDISALDSVNAPTTGFGNPMDFEARDGGTLNLSGLNSMLSAPDSISINDTSSGTILDPHLANLNGADVTLDGTDQHVADSWTKLTNGRITITGGSFKLPGLTDIDNSDVFISRGGSLSLPQLATYSPGGGFSVDGMGSVLDISGLTSVTGTSGLPIDVTNGGTTNISGLTSFSGSIVDTGGSKIIDPSLTTLGGMSKQATVTLDGTDAQISKSWVTFTNGTLKVTSGSYTFGALTKLADSYLELSGASLTLPAANLSGSIELLGGTLTVGPSNIDNARIGVDGGVMTVTSGSTFSGWSTLGADGAGSTLTLAGTSLAAHPGALLLVDAAAGGTVDMSAVTSISGGTVALRSDGQGSLINLSGLQSFTSSEGGAAVTNDGAIQSAITLPPAPDVWTGGSDIWDDYTLSSGYVVDHWFLGAPPTAGMNVIINTAAPATINMDDQFISVNRVTLGANDTLSGAGSLMTTGDFTNEGSLVVGGDDQVNIGGQFTNNGTLTLSAGGRLSVSGNETQNASAILNEQISGTPSSGGFGQLAVAGAVTLGGTLDVAVANGFVPTAGSGYPIIKFGSVNGAFTNIAGLTGGGASLSQTLEPKSLDLFVPSPPPTFTADTPPTAAVGVPFSYHFLVSSATPVSFSATGLPSWAQLDSSTGVLSGTPPHAGSFSFSVTASNGVASGTTVGVIFIVAQEGVVLPISRVEPLPATETSASFTVLWSGSDAGGPGIATYDVFVSDNGAPFAPFITATALTSAMFTGVNGHTYGFYSVATDASGSRQPTPLSAQAATDVVIGSNGGSGGGGGGLSAHGQYVTQVFNDVLDRAPDPGGLAFWTAQLDAGTPVNSVAQAIAHSDEYYANFVIKPNYLELLGRAADSAGLQYWTQQMHAGLTDQQLEAGFIASEEFFANAGGTDLDWVNAVYKLLLGRAADSDGATYWGNQLASLQTGESPEQDRSQVALRIADSQENNTDLINQDYFHYLGRAADPQGLQYWLSHFANGETNEDIIAGFTGSAEYYNDHTS